MTTNQSELVETIISILGVTDRTSGNRPEQIATLEQVIEGYITADRKRVALEAVKAYEDDLLSTIDDISNKPWRAARHIRELYENTDSGISDWYKEVADDWGLLEEFFSNGGMSKVRELMTDPKFNVNYPDRIAWLKSQQEEIKLAELEKERR